MNRKSSSGNRTRRSERKCHESRNLEIYFFFAENRTKAESNRIEKKARVEVVRAEKREAAEHRRSMKRMSDLDLFEQDFVETRRKREANETLEEDEEDYNVSDLDWNYYEYYYGEGDNYEVEIEGLSSFRNELN